MDHATLTCDDWLQRIRQPLMLDLGLERGEFIPSPWGGFQFVGRARVGPTVQLIEFSVSQDELDMRVGLADDFARFIREQLAQAIGRKRAELVGSFA